MSTGRWQPHKMSTGSWQPPLILGGGSRAEALRLVADLAMRLASWIERDHGNWTMRREERQRTADLVSLLRSAAAEAAQLAQ
jgi:uncharacterized protein YlxW (UPF0749 family)